MNRLLKDNRAFTLVELLAVIAIIGILMTLLLPRLSFVSGKARDAGVQNNFRSFRASAESYMREIAGNNPTESGLNAYLDTSTKFTSGTSALKDPWGNAYKMGVKKISNSESLITFRSPGPNNSSTSPSDLFSFTDNSVDTDDKILLTYYKNGVVLSCTAGFSQNTGTVNMATTGGSLAPVDFDVPLSFRTTAENDALSPYVYIVDVLSNTTGKTYRNYIYSNVPTTFILMSGNDYGTYYDDLYNPSSMSQLYLYYWWVTDGDMMDGYDSVFQNTPLSGGAYSNLRIYNLDGAFYNWQQIKGPNLGAVTTKQITGCN